MHQPSNEQFELLLHERGAAPIAQRSGEVVTAHHGIARSGPDEVPLMEQIIGRENLVRALHRVQRNQGSPGVDGLTVEELPASLKQHWVAIREQ